MIQKVLLALLFGISITQGNPSQAPLRVQVNPELMETMFNERGHLIFDALKSMKIKQFDPQIFASIVPGDGGGFKPSYTDDFMGIVAKDLRIKGEGTNMDKSTFTFTARIPELKLHFELDRFSVQERRDNMRL